MYCFCFIQLLDFWWFFPKILTMFFEFSIEKETFQKNSNFIVKRVTKFHKNAKYNEIFCCIFHFWGKKSRFWRKIKIKSSPHFDSDLFYGAFFKSKISLSGDILKPYHHLILNPASDSCNPSNIKKLMGKKKRHCSPYGLPKAKTFSVG